MIRIKRRRWTTGGLALLAGGALMALPAPAANDSFEVLVTSASVADGTTLGVGGDGQMVLFSTAFFNAGVEEFATADDLELKPYLRPNVELFRWRPGLDLTEQITTTANVEDEEGAGYLFLTYNDQPSLVSRTVNAFEPLVDRPSPSTTWAVAYRSNADQTKGGAAVAITEVDPRLAGGGTGHIFVRDSETEGAVNVFENFIFGGEVSLSDPSVGLKAHTVVDKIAGHSDDVVTGVAIDEVYVTFSGTVDFESDNADGNEEIFLWRRSLANRVVDGQGGGGVSNGGVRQVTHTLTGRNWNAAVNPKGEVLFLSTADITGENPEGAMQLMYWHHRRGFRQLTDNVTGTFSAPRWSANGRAAVFSSTADLVRKNPDESAEIYVLKGRRIRQVTRGTVGESTSPTLDPKGREVAFLTTADLAGMVYPSGVGEIAVVRSGGKRLRQITLTGDGGVNEGPTATRFNGVTSVTWISTSDFLGRNSNHTRRIYTGPVSR